MNAAQQIYKSIGIELGTKTHGKSKTSRKTGPGRQHIDGFPSHKKRQRIAQFLEMKARLEAATKLKQEQEATR